MNNRVLNLKSQLYFNPANEQNANRVLQFMPNSFKIFASKPEYPVHYFCLLQNSIKRLTIPP